MTFVLVVLGVLIGFASDSALMPVALGAVGYLLGTSRSVRKQLADQAHDIELLQMELRHVRRSGRDAAAERPVTPSAMHATAGVVRPTAATPAVSVRVEESAATATAELPAPPQLTTVFSATPPPNPPPPPVKSPAASGEVDSSNDWDAGLRSRAPARPNSPPSFDERVVTAVRGFLFGGNAAVRVGVLVLIVGVALLAKYAVDNGYLPVELRLVFAALIGIGLTGIGWRVRVARPAFATTLQGGGVAALYLTTFFALKVYGLIPHALAFFILVGLTAFSGALAVLQDAKVLAVFASLGGFLAPIIASSGSGDHVTLFSYYALLNAGIVGVAWFRSWRVLNLLGFAATFGIGTIWGVLSYRPSKFTSTEPFLLLFFVFYVAVAVLFALRQPPRLRGLIDGTLVFGTPLIAFGLQAGLVERLEFGLAWSALAFGLFYAAAATALVRYAPSALRMLAEAFLALAVGFGTLAIPFAFDDHRMTAATWALEGMGLVWVGVRQQRFLARFSGAALQLLAALAYVAASRPGPDRLPVLNGTCMAALAIGLAGIAISWLIYRARDQLRGFEPSIGLLFLTWGLVWWLGAGVSEIDQFLTSRHHNELAAGLSWFTLTALALELVAKRLHFTPARRATLCLLPVAYGALLMVHDSLHHPLTAGGQIVWPGTVLTLYFLLRRQQDEVVVSVAEVLHVLTFWLACIIVLWEGTWQSAHYLSTSSAWPSAACAVTVALLVAAAIGVKNISCWPLPRYRTLYMTTGLGGLLGFGYLRLVFEGLLSRADPSPLFYIPLLNPLDIASGCVFAVIVLWLSTFGRLGESLLSEVVDDVAPWLLGIAAFAWLNGSIARITHHWFGVTFTFDELSRSMLFQASLSISWSVVALGLMVFGTRVKRRPPWQVGATLLAVVVAKLVFVDLSTAGTGWQIISFLGVGTLMVVVGWVAPVPPAVPVEVVKDEPAADEQPIDEEQI